VTAEESRAPHGAQPNLKDGLRQAIIDAARRAYVEESYAGLTMRKIAARVGCTAGALYGYFSSRQELLGHVWENELEKVHVYTLGAVDQAKDNVGKLRQVFLAWVRYFMGHKEEFRIMFAWGIANGAADKVKPRSPLDGPDHSYHHFRALLRAVLVDAPRAPDDLDLAMQSLLTAAFGVVAMAHSPSQFPSYDPEEIAALSIDSILIGWGVKVPGRY